MSLLRGLKSQLFLARPLACLALALAFLAPAHAQSRQGHAIPWSNSNQPCWDAAGAYHGIDPWLLYAIGYVESRHNPAAVNGSNRNGTRDVGMMQINSIWLPELRKHGVTEAALTNACASTYIGAWIMAKNIRKHGYTWEAIAVYNVGSLTTPARVRIGKAYARKVYAAYEKLVRERGAGRS